MWIDSYAFKETGSIVIESAAPQTNTAVKTEDQSSSRGVKSPESSVKNAFIHIHSSFSNNFKIPDFRTEKLNFYEYI